MIPMAYWGPHSGREWLSGYLTHPISPCPQTPTPPPPHTHTPRWSNLDTHGCALVGGGARLHHPEAAALVGDSVPAGGATHGCGFPASSTIRLAHCVKGIPCPGSGGGGYRCQGWPADLAGPWFSLQNVEVGPYAKVSLRVRRQATGSQPNDDKKLEISTAYQDGVR